MIDDGHVGLSGDGFGDGLFAVRRFGDNTPVGMVFKDAPHTRAHHGVVISDQDAGHAKVTKFLKPEPNCCERRSAPMPPRR